MTVDSSTAAVTGSGSDGNSPSGQISLPSPWAQVVRGGSEPDSLYLSPSAVVSERNPVFSDPSTVVELEAMPAPAVIQPEGSDGGNNCNAGGVKKSAWSKPSANGVVEGKTNTPVMGAASWPALSELTRSGMKSLSSSSESSSKLISDGSAIVSQAPVASQSPQKQAKTNPNNTHSPRQRPLRRGGASTGYNRPPPPPPPPLPPPFPLFDMSYANLVPTLLDSPIIEQPQRPFKGNNWTPRSSGSSQDHSFNRNRNNFGPLPYLNNGYGGRRDHHDRDWRGPRMVPPPPPPYIRQPHPGPAPFIRSQPLRPYGTPMGYDMGASYLYVPTLPPEPYRGAPILPHTASGSSMFIPVMDPQLNVLILKQIEYYFSDANLVKDNFLRSNMDEEGWVPITLIAGFRRVLNLTKDIQTILNSLRDSTIVEIQGEKLRRRNEWNRWVRSSLKCETTDGLIEETSIQNLALEDNKQVGASDSDSDSSKLIIANGEVSS